MKKTVFFKIFSALCFFCTFLFGELTAQTWDMVDISQLSPGDIFMIVDINSGRALANDGGASAAPAAVVVSFNDDTTQVTSVVDDNLKWNIGSEEDGYVFYPNGDNAIWLYCNNTNNGPVTGAGYYTAGIAGYCYYGYYQQYNINNADITSTSYYTGGIFGYSYYNYYNQYNENRGDVTGGGLYTGGINGYNYGSNYYCRYNLNSGNVSSTSYYVGGINGYANYTYTDYCVNVGRVSSTYSGNAFVGGITGFATSSSAYTRYCLNAGKVSGYTYVGGIAGEGYYGNYISYCLNVGDVEGTVTGYTAAIAGYAYSGAPDNCYWDKQMCPTAYIYGTTTSTTQNKVTTDLVGQNTYPSATYFTSGRF